MTTLVACSHGTDSAAGRRTVAEIVDLVRARVPDTKVVQAFVDVQEPTLAAVVDHERSMDDVVVVPLLLSAGFHTAVDIDRVVRPHVEVRQGAPLGAHPLVAEVLAARLHASVSHRWFPGDHVVLAAAGSRNPDAVVDVAAAATHLRRLIPAPVTIGYASAIEPRITDAVQAARDDGATRVVAASHVLAPGYFAGLVEKCGADVVSAPLGVDPRIADVVVERFRSA
ncbi:CbiX/SirB N-terminal domain-containing protein [Microbacterium sp. NPDC028030]|uniref:sirohydrochlorin chelatase n=1 Tax=Microbacterium sp. NPDC028030 TaxID=3155124 RepID=UPI0033C5A898